MACWAAFTAVCGQSSSFQGSNGDGSITIQTSPIGGLDQQLLDLNTVIITISNNELEHCQVRTKRAFTSNFGTKHVVTNANEWNMLTSGQVNQINQVLINRWGVYNANNRFYRNCVNTFINLINTADYNNFYQATGNVPCPSAKTARSVVHGSV